MTQLYVNKDRIYWYNLVDLSCKIECSENKFDYKSLARRLDIQLDKLIAEHERQQKAFEGEIERITIEARNQVSEVEKNYADALQVNVFMSICLCVGGWMLLLGPWVYSNLSYSCRSWFLFYIKVPREITVMNGFGKFFYFVLCFIQ